MTLDLPLKPKELELGEEPRLELKLTLLLKVTLYISTLLERRRYT